MKHPTRYGITFTEEEVKVLADIMQTPLRQGDVRIIMRSPVARRCAEKIIGAKARREKVDA